MSAEFVDEMREVFGQDVKVLYVKEGELEVGEPAGQGATCLYVSDGRTIQEAYGDTSRAKPRAKNKTARAR
jgi:hypothetical protein